MPMMMAMTESSNPQAVTEPERDAAAAVVATPVSKWAIHRRLYDWVLSFAHHKHSTTALFLLSFAESSFFPIPPDVLLMPLCLGNRRKAFWFAFICTLASVLGGIAGYYIGYAAWEATKDCWFRFIPGFKPAQFDRVGEWYQAYGFWIVFTAAFTPIPYKVFTIAAGVFHNHVGLLPFIIASIIGRGLRFFLVAGLMWKFGRPIVRFIDKYFNLLCIVFTVLLIGGFALIKYMH
jgi:membrane protein YqaA with SNARE-associated domain